MTSEFNKKPLYLDKHIVVCRAHYESEYLTHKKKLPRFIGEANCWYCIQEGRIKI